MAEVVAATATRPLWMSAKGHTVDTRTASQPTDKPWLRWTYVMSRPERTASEGWDWE